MDTDLLDNNTIQAMIDSLDKYGLFLETQHCKFRMRSNSTAVIDKIKSVANYDLICDTCAELDWHYYIYDADIFDRSALARRKAVELYKKTPLYRETHKDK